MRIFRGFEAVPEALRGACLAIGNFDGVHRGHRAVIAAAAEMARARRRPFGVLTFEPHPREVLDPERAPARLSPFARKAELLRDLGVEILFVLRFGPGLMRLSAGQFVERVLLGAYAVAGVATGEDFRFGHRRAGDVARLRELGAARGFAVRAVPKLVVEGSVCSSTRIRTALAAGDVRLAARLLGYSFEVRGGVVEGDRRGRELGYPTANVRPVGRRPLLPGNGIYAVRAAVREVPGWRWHPAVASLGVRPTFGGGEVVLEVHLLDGERDLYGRRLRVAFLERLREERRFPSIEALKREMARDCARAREILALTTVS